MKWRIFLLALTASSAVYLSSCQQEIDGLMRPQDSDTNYLTRVISLDTTLPSGQDTALIGIFRYDAQKRLQYFDFTEIGSGGVRYVSNFTYYYKSSTDTVPFRMKQVISPDSVVTYYFYQNGFVNRDSIINYTGGSIDFYKETFFSSLGGNRYLKKEYQQFPGGGGWSLTDSSIYYRTVTQGNLTSIIDSTWDGNGFYQQRTTELLTYESKNGFAKRFDTWYLGYYDNLVNEVWPGGQNNSLSYTFTSDYFPPVNTSYTLTHQYNTADYPVVSRLSGNQDVNKQVFIYTRQ